MNNIQLKTTEPNHISSTPDINGRYTAKDKSKLANAAEDFESMLTSMMLKSMNKTTNGMFGSDSFGGDFFDTIFESEMAKYISHNKGLGIAKVLYKKLTGEDLDPLLKKVNEIPSEKINKADINTITDFPALPPSAHSLKRLDKFSDYINEAAEKFGIDKNIIKSVILTESAGKENAVSSAKAKGLMQLIDTTAKDMGVRNVWDPRENIFGGTKYLSQLLKSNNGDLKLALAGYNAGPGNVEKFNGVPPFEETKNYINRVMGYLNYLNG